MKDRIKIIAVLMLISMLAFIACEGGDTGGAGDDTIAVTGITLNDAVDIRIGQTEQLTAIIEPADASNQEVRWMSSDEAVAEVSGTGLVTMKANGWTTIIVAGKDGGFIAQCTVSVLYNLRDAGPAGGLVFYDKGSYSNGWRYLEAAPSDQSTDISWGNEGSLDARSKCAGLALGGYSDWFLPSKDELNKMYVNLHLGTDENSDSYTRVGGFAGGTDYYWSSTKSSGIAWCLNFHRGEQDSDGGNPYNYRVRAIRAF